MILADIVKRNVWLRPEYGRPDAPWPCIGFRFQSVLTRFLRDYKVGDIVISTGIMKKQTPQQYRSKILSALTIERMEVATKEIVSAESWQRHIQMHGRAQWPNCCPALTIHHLAINQPYPDAHDYIPQTYKSLDYTSGSDRDVAGAIRIEGRELQNILMLPIREVKFDLSQRVIDFQEYRRQAKIGS